jgi:hypothetical protein
MITYTSYLNGIAGKHKHFHYKISSQSAMRNTF